LSSDEFKKEARIILLNQPRENVDQFFTLIDKGPGVGLAPFSDDLLAKDDEKETIYEDHSHVFSAEERVRTCLPAAERKKYYEATLCLLELIRNKELGLIRIISSDDIYAELTRLEVLIYQDHILNTGGKRSALNLTDLFELIKLQQGFSSCFPDRSARFRGDNLIVRLGEKLIGKPIPKSIDKMCEKLDSYIDLLM